MQVSLRQGLIDVAKMHREIMMLDNCNRRYDPTNTSSNIQIQRWTLVENICNNKSSNRERETVTWTISYFQHDYEIEIYKNR